MSLSAGDGSPVIKPSAAAIMVNKEKNLIIFENTLAKIGISTADGRTAFILDKRSGENVAAADGGPFFAFRKKGGDETAAADLTCDGNVISGTLDGGRFAIRADCFERYFAFQILSLDSPFAEEFYFGCLSVSKKADSLSVGVFGASMTVGVDPVYFPDFSGRRTRGMIVPRLSAAGARYALAVAPFEMRKSILEEVFGAVDRSKGIVSGTGGVWGRDCAANFGNYTIQFDSSIDLVSKNLPFFRSIGVDQIDFHKGPGTFRQGDFLFAHYGNAAGFKSNVTELLEKNGLTAGLHTYSHYIDYGCDAMLSDGSCRSQLKVTETFTLERDVDEADTVFTVDEDVSGISVDFGFCAVNTPFLLIDDELVTYKSGDAHGLSISGRGLCGTSPASHKKGAAVKHLEGRYYGLTPVPGSDLFYDVARRTAVAFNEGGFGMIYLDALDGIASHCAANENSFYVASFVHEVLKNCERDPVLEGATFTPSMWAARGRTGAWDTPSRAYKRFNALHAESNKAFIERFGVPVLGWYDFYPLEERYPGNEHVKYHHTDDVDHMGSLAVAYGFPNVFNGLTPEALAKYPALRRNVFLYKKYDDLRKSGAVPESIREKMRASEYELRLLPGDGPPLTFENEPALHFEKETALPSGKDPENAPGRPYPAFQEAAYGKAKLYDLADSRRNHAKFSNPFRAQRPFVRIEALLSAENEDIDVLVGNAGTDDAPEFPFRKRFETALDISERLAKHVRIRGNGQKGSKIAVKLGCATDAEKGLAEYVVDTDFTGEREFLLIETDNGERSDHSFEKNEELYPIYRTPFNNDRVTEISVEAEGNTEGVVLSPITTRAHISVEIKDPEVVIGGTSAVFKCLLRSTDFIEFDGEKAFVLDRYGNRREIGFESDLTAPRGEFTASLTFSGDSREDAYVKRAALTLGFYGDVLQ